MHEWHGYRGSIMDIIYQCRDEAELREFDSVLVRAVMAGRLKPRSRTLRKWRAAAKERAKAIRGARLYLADGGPAI